MIVPLPGGQSIEIRFSYDRRGFDAQQLTRLARHELTLPPQVRLTPKKDSDRTVCEACWIDEQGRRSTTILKAIVAVKPGRFCREVGRREALKMLLHPSMLLTRETRKAIWNAYSQHCKVGPNDKRFKPKPKLESTGA